MAYHPFMLRRGNVYHIRIQVPIDLRNAVGQREFTKSLRTGSQAQALPLALELGAVAKRLFHQLRRPTMTSKDMLKLLREAKQKLSIDSI